MSISRLPNELLSRIFLTLRNRYIKAAEQKRRHGVKCLKGWIGITYVCHRWREVALNTSLLWCHIDILSSFRRWIPELLRRSDQSLLTIVVVDFRVLDALVDVQKQYRRVCELVLDDPHCALEIFNFLWESDFQNLETLDITGGHFHESRFRARSLRRLILHNCTLTLNSECLHRLSYLVLVNIHPSSRLSLHDVTLALSKIPSLETLHLSQILHKKGQDQTRQATKVHLQHLQLLFLDDDMSEVARLLTCLVVPRSCKLRIITGNDPIDDEFRTIFSWLSNQLRVPTTSIPTLDTSNQGQCIRSFHLSFDPDKDLKVEGFYDVLSHEQMQTADPILKFFVRESDYDSSFDLGVFLSLLPISDVTFLDVFVALSVGLQSPRFWTVPFGSIQTITNVYLEAETSSFWKALTRANSDNGTVKSLPFPALTSITVEDHYFDSRLVLDNLRVRSQLGGTQLQNLRFSRHGFVPPEPFLLKLSELVSHVGIHDAEGRFDDSDSDESDEE